MKTVSVRTIYILVALLAVGAIYAIYIAIGNAFVEGESGYQISFSIADSKKYGVFVSEPTMKNHELNINGYRIEEAWVEQKTLIKYHWLFFQKRDPVGYQIVI